MAPGPQIDEGDSFRIDNLIRGKAQDRAETKYFRDPVIRLMLAVLEDAVNCYVKYEGAKSRRGQRIFREAKEWFFSDDANWLFSYENICDLVGINPNYLRSGILRNGAQSVAGEVDRAPELRSTSKVSRRSAIRPIPQLRDGLRAHARAAVGA
jgi:hypothetical protein